MSSSFFRSLLVPAMSSPPSTMTLSRIKTELHVPRNKWEDKNISPDHIVVWTEPHHNRRKKVPVVYYLSRNGHLEHPHFIQVPLSSPHGLYLQDVILRLNSLRGKGMASKYSWSCKRSYKSGYVWNDLEEKDYIHPTNGNEYVLKGSEILDNAVMQSSISKNMVPEIVKHAGRDVEEVVRRQRHQSWSAFDLPEYKTEYTGVESMQRADANASTQIDEKRHCQGENPVIFEDEDDNEKVTELKKHEVSPPPLDSSPETLETLMKARVNQSQRSKVNEKSTLPIGQINEKSKSTSLLMQLFSCGAMSFKDCGPGKGDGFNLILNNNKRLSRDEDRGSNRVEKEAGNSNEGRRRKGVVVVVEDKEYFSGSIVETKKIECPYLRRSSSYNADN